MSEEIGVFEEAGTGGAPGKDKARADDEERLRFPEAGEPRLLRLYQQLPYII